MTEHRWESLDVLRGFALLGILIMNVQSFGLPMAAYSNPTAYGDFEGINRLAWWFTQLFFEKKFISLFSLLFGAGILLFAESVERKGLRPGRLHYRRMVWLLMFGLLHGWLLWFGDILFAYAIAGMVVYLMRLRTNRALLLTSAVFFSVPVLAYHLLIILSMPYWPEEDVVEMQLFWAPTEAMLQSEVAAMTGSLSEQFVQRAEWTLMMQTDALLFITFWYSGAFMMLGMVLYRTGFLSGQWSARAYGRLAWLILPGLALTLTGMIQQHRHEFDFASSFVDTLWFYFAAPVTMLGYAGLMLLWLKSPAASALRYRLACLGRTAFSHYILQTLMGVLIFYWLGFFGQWERSTLLLLAILIGAGQLAVAPFWLRHFKQGPLEALWRKLTYGKG